MQTQVRMTFQYFWNLHLSRHCRVILRRHFPCLRFLPTSLHALLGDADCVKLGVGISDDARKLRDDFGSPVRGWFDIRHLVAEHRPEAK